MNRPTSQKGVYQTRKKDGSIYYRASLTYHKKHISLGSYSMMETAHLAYLEGLSILSGETASSIYDYPSQSVLPFEKWISLMNLHDHGIYFSTPIYLRNKYFEYFINKDYILKFDTDDLFYYSSHKIMKRNGHLFVADYGMQVNILNRYGIKNYARIGIDYCFLNNDPHDFRYENIEIKNSYHGVTSFIANNKKYYKCTIHIHGNFIVGNYNSPIEAAIAYNKAIDILKRNNVRKNFSPNYIESISQLEYAKIYHSLEISSKICDYFSP